MVSLLNSTCAKFEDVARTGSRYELEAALLYVKGTWLPSEFTVSVCDGTDAWTGRASEEFVVENASRMGLTESEYVDRVQLCFSKQHPDAKYELKWGKSLSPELICAMPQQQQPILKLQTTTDSGPRVAADMVQLLLDAHHGLSEELAQKTRGFEREIAVKERSLTVLQKQLEGGNESLKGGTNGHVNEDEGEVAALKATTAGTSSRVKRKGSTSNAETGSRKRTTKISEPLPPFQKHVSPEKAPLLEKALATRPLPLSALGYKQQSKETETPRVRSWADAVGRSNGMTDDSLSEGRNVGGRKAFLDNLADVAEPKTDPLPARKANRKRPGKSGGRKVSKRPQPQPSLEDSLDQVEDVVKKGIQCVDNITHSQDPLEVSSPVTTPVKPQRKPLSSGKKPPSSKDKKPKIQAPSRSSRKKVKPRVVESADDASEPELELEAESEPSEAPEIVAGPGPGADEDREIDVQNAEFNDFDASRNEGSFEEGQFWALYDDQDGMPRFYGHVTGVQSEPFQVSVEWLEPFKPNTPATSLVKTAKLSPSCGEFTFGAVCLQDLAAFSHVVDVDKDPKRSMVNFWPRKDEIWALYRHWDKKQAKKEDGDQTFYYEYDLVQVASTFSTSDGLTVVPLIKVDGFKSLFTVAGETESYHIPLKQVQVRFSHYIPQHIMIGVESPGVPPGAWELDPASTPSDYLGSVAQEGNNDEDP